MTRRKRANRISTLGQSTRQKLGCRVKFGVDGRGMKTMIPTSFRRLGKNRDELEVPQKRNRELSLYLAILVGVFCFIAIPFAAAVFFPRMVLAVAVVFTSWFLIEHFRFRRSLKQSADASIPLRCAACGSEELNQLSSGLWDGRDDSGKSTSGAFHYAVCKTCGSRCVQYEEGKPRLPTDEEWDAHFRPIKEHTVRAHKWPFVS